MNPLVPVPVIVPFAAAAVLAAVNLHIPRRLADAIAILATVVTGTVSLLLLHGVREHPIVYWFGGWTPRSGVAIGISFVVDPMSAALAAFVSVLVLTALLFSLEYFDSIGTMFHVLMLGFLGGMCGFSLTGDLFNLFVFFEVMSAAAYALCGYKTDESTAQQGALNFAVTNTAGAFLTLWGIALLYARTGALNMAQIGRALGKQSDVLVITAFVLIVVGFYVKAAAFPFHFWLADAHAVAPTPVCVLFSGVMVELGVYAVARVYWTIFDGPFAAVRPALTSVFLVVGTITAVLGGAMCFGQRHIKRLLAFSTISHVGLLIIGFALVRPDALAGAAIYTVGHGFVKSALFIVAGILLHRFGSVDEFELHGRARGLRWTAAIAILGALGLAGLVPFATFNGQHSIEETAAKSGQHWVWIVFFVAAALTSAAVFRFSGRVFFGLGSKRPGDKRESGKKIHEKRETESSRRVPATMFVPAAVLVLAAIAVAVVPGIRQASRVAAFTMADAAGYQARVLDGAALPLRAPGTEASGIAASLMRSVGATLLALVLAGWALSPRWPSYRRVPSLPRRVAGALRDLHSGRIGDYIAYLTFGTAALLVALTLLVRHLLPA